MFYEIIPSWVEKTSVENALLKLIESLQKKQKDQNWEDNGQRIEKCRYRAIRFSW